MKTILISLPWADYSSPSAAIGTLASYAKQRGFDIEARHLHLEVAAHFGFEDYDNVVDSFSEKTENKTLRTPSCEEALSASLLFPQQKEKILKYSEKRITNAKKYAKHLRRVLRKLYKEIDWSKYGLVGFTTNFDQLFSSLLIAKWIKKDHPHIKTILGGPIVADELGISILRTFSQIDWCVDGEGEPALIKLLDGLEKNNQSFESAIPGLIYRNDRAILCNRRSKPINLKGLPDPDYDHYFNLLNEHPLLTNREIMPYIPLEVSRGCTHRCAFCSLSQFMKGYHARPTSEVSDSLKRMSKKYQATSFAFVALSITPKCCEELLPKVAKHQRDYKIACEIRANITKDQLLKMKRAGVCEVQIGIEALDTNLLKKMNKGTRSIENLQVMKYCEELGIKHNSNFIINFPGESQRDLDHNKKVIDFACAYRPLNFSRFALLYNSPIFCRPSKYGLYNIVESQAFTSALPRDVSKNIHLLSKDYKSKKKSCQYRYFFKRCKEWEQLYKASQLIGRPLLYYLDFNDFIRIEDYRTGNNSITLENWMRDLYLYCDSIKNWSDIKNHFSDCDPKELKRTLNKLYKLKVIYREGNDYLSLAIRSANEYRHHMPVG